MGNSQGLFPRVPDRRNEYRTFRQSTYASTQCWDEPDRIALQIMIIYLAAIGIVFQTEIR
jgi:hypothetical protein